MGRKPPKWLPGERVQETILTQRKTVEQLRADRIIRKPKLKDQRSRLKAKIDAKRTKRLKTKRFVSAQTILTQAIKKEKQSRGFWKRGEKFMSRHARKAKDKIETQYTHAPIALVVRIVGNKDVPREVDQAFSKLGLTKLYQARFFHLTPHTDGIIKQLKSFSVIGFPTASQIEDLIRTRGCFWNKETKSKTYITGNLHVEQVLGASCNILSIEEMVDAIVSKSSEQVQLIAGAVSAIAESKKTLEENEVEGGKKKSSKKKSPANQKHGGVEGSILQSSHTLVDEVLRNLAPFDFHPPHALNLERERSLHDRRELANPHAFSKYLAEQLHTTQREKKLVQKKAFKLAIKKKQQKTVIKTPKKKRGVVATKALSVGKEVASTPVVVVVDKGGRKSSQSSAAKGAAASAVKTPSSARKSAKKA